MVEPRIIPRAEHSLSRKDVDPDALKVLYRLRQYDHVAYLVGGSVRDLLLGRRPKDFDIGTSAHPYQVKKLFRNCWIIGRRFRLAHVKFGTKTIEVATFRRQVAPGEEVVQDGVPAPGSDDAGRRAARASRQHVRHARGRRVPPRLHDQRALLRHRDVLGHRLRRRPRRSPRGRRPLDRRSAGAVPRGSGADAARGGDGGAPRLHDRSARPRRDPRAAATKSRARLPPRMLEEYYKILRSGAAEKTFRMLAQPRPARADLGGAAPRLRRAAVAIARRGGRVPPPVRGHSGHDDQPGAARQPARAARPAAAARQPIGAAAAASARRQARAKRRRRRPSAGTRRDRSSASCRSRAGTSSV